MRKPSLRHAIRGRLIAAFCALCVLVSSPVTGGAVRAAEPIAIGFGMPLTGSLALNGKAVLLAIQMWAEDVNAKGGVLERPIKLVYYDDQSNPAALPGIYTKLVDLDKVDFIVSSLGTTQVVPIVPFAMQRGMVLLTLCGLSTNENYKYDRYFAACPLGVNARVELPRGFFEVAAAQRPKPQTIAIVGVDIEFSKTVMDGARELAATHGFKIVYDKTYPSNIVDLTPIVRAIQAAKPDIVFVASYPVDSANFIKAVNELDFKPKMLGGAMVGLQYAALKTKLGPLLNGVVNYELYVPEPTMQFPGMKDFIERYQARAAALGVDQLGFLVPPYAYAGMQVLQQAIEKVGSLDQGKIADYIRSNEFRTIVGQVKFGENGEWSVARDLVVQYQNIQGNGIEQFRKAGTQVILYPPDYKSGQIIYPYK